MPPQVQAGSAEMNVVLRDLVAQQPPRGAVVLDRDGQAACEIAHQADVPVEAVAKQFAGETDGKIADPILRRRLRLTKQNSRTTVVWNPWSTGAQSLADLGDEWRSMACVEASNMRAYGVDLAPGQQHTMKTVIQVEAAPGDSH